MDETKIQFSGAEMELMNNATIILTKNAVLYKIRLLLESLQAEMMSITASDSRLYKQRFFEPTPKISRGEAYQGLPYLVLDYPRQFELTDILVVRTLFWWGNHFSLTLQMAGKYREQYTYMVAENYAGLKQRDFYIGIGDDPWQHHFEEDNYTPISSLSAEEFSELCNKGEHLKIAKSFPLWDVHFVSEELLHNWQYLVELCAN